MSCGAADLHAVNLINASSGKAALSCAGESTIQKTADASISHAVECGSQHGLLDPVSRQRGVAALGAQQDHLQLGRQRRLRVQRDKPASSTAAWIVRLRTFRSREGRCKKGTWHVSAEGLAQIFWRNAPSDQRNSSLMLAVVSEKLGELERELGNQSQIGRLSAQGSYQASQLNHPPTAL